MAKSPRRPRSARRELERDLAKMREATAKLYALELGGSPERPIEIVSPSQVEVDAESRRCPSCDGELRCEAHEVEESRGLRVRVARLVCRACRARWSRYYRVGAVLN